MTHQLSVDSIVIGSQRSDELKDWYRETFDISEDDDGAFVFGPVRVFVFPHDEVSGSAREPARILINLRVEDARSVESDLKAKGVGFVRDVTEEPFGLLGTIADLDGNYLQIFQPTYVRAVLGEPDPKGDPDRDGSFRVR